jgi:hypothetical protein
MNRLLSASLLIALLLCGGAGSASEDNTPAPEASRPAPPVELTEEDRRIVEMLELLEMLEMLKEIKDVSVLEER